MWAGGSLERCALHERRQSVAMAAMCHGKELEEVTSGQLGAGTHTVSLVGYEP